MPPEVAQNKDAKNVHVDEQFQRQTDQLLALVQATKAPRPPKPVATEWVLGGQEWTLNVPAAADQMRREREGGPESAREADRDRDGDRAPDVLAVERERDRERGARELAGGQPRGNSRPARQQHISSSGAGSAAGSADGGAGAGMWGSKGPTGLQLLRSLVSSGTAGVGVAGLLNGGVTALNLAGLTGGACDQLLEDLQAFGVIKKGGGGGGAGVGSAPAATGLSAGDASGRGGPAAVGNGGVGSGYGPPAAGVARSRVAAGSAGGDTLGGREPPAREQASPQQAAQPPRKPNKRPENGSLATQILKRQRLQEEQAAAIAGSGSGGGSGGVAGGSVLASLGQAGASGLLLGGAGGVASGGLGGLPGAGGMGAIGGGNGTANALYRLAMQSSPSAISAVLDAAGPLGVSGTPLNALAAALAARRGAAGSGGGGTIAGSIAELLAQHGAAGLPAAALGLAGGAPVGMGGGAGALAALGGAAGAGGAPPQVVTMLRDLPITDALLTGLKRVGPLTVALGVPVPKRKRCVAITWKWHQGWSAAAAGASCKHNLYYPAVALAVHNAKYPCWSHPLRRLPVQSRCTPCTFRSERFQ